MNATTRQGHRNHFPILVKHEYVRIKNTKGRKAHLNELDRQFIGILTGGVGAVIASYCFNMPDDAVSGTPYRYLCKTTK